MKLTGISNSFIYITVIFLSLESCCCILLDRGQQDKIDFLNGQNCASVKSSNVINRHVHGGRCECRKGEGTLGSPNDGNEIKCFEMGGFDGGTNICLL